MRVVRGSPDGWGLDVTGSAVALGVFDGVHRGHEVVIRRAVSEAALTPAVLTFGIHPAALLSPHGPPPMLTTLERRLELIEDLGVAIAAVIDFDEQLRALSPETFVSAYLLDGLAARHVVSGEDFRFGHRAAGDVALLGRLGAARGFGVTAVGPVAHDGTEVRSTAIRAQLAAGDVAGAATLLGRPHEVAGRVVRGDGRGRTIGVPTANLDVPEGLAVPASGVYAVTTVVAGRAEQGVANIGVRPTFDGGSHTVEVHVLDFAGDLYGQPLTMRFIDHIRDEQRFAGADDLVAQIHVDIATARELLRRTS